MSATEQGLNVRGRWDPAPPELSPEQATAVARFHDRTGHSFGRVRDLTLMGKYAEIMGWKDIAQALLPTAA